MVYTQHALHITGRKMDIQVCIRKSIHYTAGSSVTTENINKRTQHIWEGVGSHVKYNDKYTRCFMELLLPFVPFLYFV